MTDINININFCKTTLISKSEVTIDELIHEVDKNKYKSLEVSYGSCISFISKDNSVVFKTYIDSGKQKLSLFLDRLKDALSLYRHTYRDLDIETILDMFNINYVEILI